jgi:hypothetical protein
LLRFKTRLVRARLSLLRCETRLVTAHLTSTHAYTIYKFSLTSSIRTHDHRLLNTRQFKGYKDLKEPVLHKVFPISPKRGQEQVWEVTEEFV